MQIVLPVNVICLKYLAPICVFFYYVFSFQYQIEHYPKRKTHSQHLVGCQESSCFFSNVHFLCQERLTPAKTPAKPTRQNFPQVLKRHCHGILASCYNAEICSCINGNPKIMMQFCYLGLYHYTETFYCCLSLIMARMEMD